MYETIYPVIRIRLQDSISDILDSAFDGEIEQALFDLLAPYSLAYASLTSDDLVFVDRAAGLLVASRLITPYSTGGASGDLASEKSGLMDLSRSFSSVDGGEKARWEMEAGKSIARTSFAKARRTDSVFFAVNGPSRNRCEP